MNLMLQWDLKFNLEKPIYSAIRLGTCNFEDECANFDIERSQKIYEHLALIKLTRKLELPFPLIYDPVGVGFRYIQNLEKGAETETITSLD